MNEALNRNITAAKSNVPLFLFAEGATTAAEAIAIGYKSFGNIMSVSAKHSMEKIDHTGNYRDGGPRRDATYVSNKEASFQITCDELTAEQVAISSMGTIGSQFTQSVLTLQAVDALAFGTTNAVAGRWYPLTYNGALLRDCTVINVPKGNAVSCTCEADDDTVTKSSHGLSNGQPLIFGGSAVPTGITANQRYYVINAATDTFKVSATEGGAAVNMTTDGTSVTYTLLYDEDTEVVTDLVLGQVKMLTTVAANVTPIVSCPAITTADAGAMTSVTPLDNPIKEGIGRVMKFDEDGHCVYDWYGFSCQLYPESEAASDGKTTPETVFNVRVGETVGTEWVRYANELDE
jgi:hypothetical protein